MDPNLSASLSVLTLPLEKQKIKPFLMIIVTVCCR